MISIITVSYNSSKTISRTIESILKQTYINYEYIIIDGNSKDGTQNIIASYEKTFDGRLRWISEPDSGIYQAMNKGLRMCLGDVIGIVNSDDWLELDALEKIAKSYQFTSENIRNNTIYCGEVKFHYEEGSQLLPVNEEMFYRNIKKKSLRGAWHPAIFVPKAVYSRVGLFDEKFKVIGDVDLIYRCFKEKCNFQFIQEVLSNMSDGGLSSMRNNIYTEDRKWILKKHQTSIASYYFNLCKGSAYLFVKSLMPLWFIKKYRDYLYRQE